MMHTKLFTRAEESLLAILKENRGTVMPIERLLSALPDNGFRKGSNDNNLIATHIRSIRMKLADTKERIENERGVGYKLV